MDELNKTKIIDNLLAWYKINRRILPWREKPEPYPVLVSEIMLQQTRVETVIPYFERWMQRFPSIHKLAAASEQDVLKTWEGLGYYGRARNLYKTAGIILQQFGGEIPCSKAELEKLPGIGRYTAGAVASIACGRDEPVLDGNVARVYGRLFNIPVAVDSREGQRILHQLANKMLPPGKAGIYNQALMDLGATICLPGLALCERCPIREYCQSFCLGIQNERPLRKLKQPVPLVTVTAAVINREDKVLIAKRPSPGLLGGLWEFPGGKVEKDEDLVNGLQREIREELGVEIIVGNPVGTYRHAYTHFKVRLHAFYCGLRDGEPEALQANALLWVEPGELGNYPMGKIDRQISNLLASILEAPEIRK